MDSRFRGNDNRGRGKKLTFRNATSPRTRTAPPLAVIPAKAGIQARPATGDAVMPVEGAYTRSALPASTGTFVQPNFTYLWNRAYPVGENCNFLRRP